MIGLLDSSHLLLLPVHTVLYGTGTVHTRSTNTVVVLLRVICAAAYTLYVPYCWPLLYSTGTCNG